MVGEAFAGAFYAILTLFARLLCVLPLRVWRAEKVVSSDNGKHILRAIGKRRPIVGSLDHLLPIVSLNKEFEDFFDDYRRQRLKRMAARLLRIPRAVWVPAGLVRCCRARRADADLMSGNLPLKFQPAAIGACAVCVSCYAVMKGYADHPSEMRNNRICAQPRPTASPSAMSAFGQWQRRPQRPT